MVVAGKVTVDQVKNLCDKWFAPIASPKKPVRSIPVEPPQVSKRTSRVEANVPANALYKAFHMPGRFDKDYYAADLLSDVLGHGQSSRLVHQLVKEQEIFTSINAHGLGSIDPGLLVISGRLNEGISFETAEAAVDAILSEIVSNGIKEDELEKVKNQAQSMLEFGEVEVINRAMNLAFAFLSGDPDLVNQESKRISMVSRDDVRRVGANILRPGNSSVMYYAKQ